MPSLPEWKFKPFTGPSGPQPPPPPLDPSTGMPFKRKCGWPRKNTSGLSKTMNTSLTPTDPPPTSSVPCPAKSRNLASVARDFLHARRRSSSPKQGPAASDVPDTPSQPLSTSPPSLPSLHDPARTSGVNIAPSPPNPATATTSSSATGTRDAHPADSVTPTAPFRKHAEAPPPPPPLRTAPTTAPPNATSNAATLESIAATATRSSGGMGASTSASARDALARVRELAGGAGGMLAKLLPAPLPPSQVPQLVTGSDVDAQPEYDSRSFVHGDGLGNEDGDADSETTAGFPTWLVAVVAPRIKELKLDLEKDGVSRHYTNGTFMIPAKVSYFLMQKSNLKPEETFAIDVFIWDPFSLLPSANRCPCPECGHHLTHDGVVNRPRRVVDIGGCFWLIGCSYACRSVHGCGKRFRSWDRWIVDSLPPELACEFPAHLTWRSALSLRAFGVVRSCFQHGMGSSEVSDLFRMQALRRYDEMRLQYLRVKLKYMHLNLLGQTYKEYPVFEDRSPRGFHGFTPSGQWLRNIYDDIIEFKHDVLNQHTAMLSARICAIDHSHKLAKHVFKVDGVPIFTALLTVTNEKGEIIICVFVATKSHSQFEDALKRLAHDLVVYGHSLPEVFHTDNMVDKSMLEKIFPSLLEAFVPVEKYSALPLLDTPSFVRNPQVLDSDTEINNAMQAILDDVPEGGKLIIGFDSEWNVDMTQYGRFNGASPPAVIQIAYKDSVFILRVGEMLKRGMLPTQLVNLLRHEHVIKAGRQVGGDLGRLATTCNRPPGDFCGGLDLAAFAKARFLVKKATLSLADLVAILLGQCLPKPTAERISTAWSDAELSQAQIEYAARDAYASLVLYNKINETPAPTILPTDELLIVDTPVLLLTDDNKKPAARGFVSEEALSTSFNDTNITKTRTVLTIEEVLIPAAIIGINKDIAGRKRALNDFGPVPFKLVAHRAHVCVVTRPPTLPSVSSESLPTPPLEAPSKPPEPDQDLVSSFENLDDGDEDDGPPTTIISATPDAQSVEEGVAHLGPEVDLSHLHQIRSRVLKDIFHVFHMLYLSRTHGL